jgi:hypothetical protein
MAEQTDTSRSTNEKRPGFNAAVAVINEITVKNQKVPDSVA